MAGSYSAHFSFWWLSCSVVTGVGGNEGIEWFLFAISALVLGLYFVYQRKLSLAKMGARYLLAVERGLTMDDALEICRKYSFLILISAGIFLAAGVAAIFVY